MPKSLEVKHLESLRVDQNDVFRRTCLLVLPWIALASVNVNSALGQDALNADTQPRFSTQTLFDSVRIPNIVVTTDGTVLAFARSGRLLRRSTDCGKTWSEPREIGSDASGSAIINDTDGSVMVVNSREGFLWISQDQGKSWTRKTCEIKPNAIQHGTPGGVPVVTTCSESGLTLKYGKHPGRLLMPARVQPPLWEQRPGVVAFQLQHGYFQRRWW